MHHTTVVCGGMPHQAVACGRRKDGKTEACTAPDERTAAPTRLFGVDLPALLAPDGSGIAITDGRGSMGEHTQ